jgi:hypothetical protein
MRLLPIVALLIGCTSSPPPFTCCGTEYGEETYPVPRDTQPPSTEQIHAAQELLTTPGLLHGTTALNVALGLRDHAQSWAFWKRAGEVSETVQFARMRAEALNVSPVLIGAAYLESRLHAHSTSPSCDSGVWQLPLVQSGVRVEECRGRGLREDWQVGEPLTVDGYCAIAFCSVDERQDLDLATPAGLQANRLWGHSPSRAVAVYALLTCMTDDPLPICEDVFVTGPPSPRSCIR